MNSKSESENENSIYNYNMIFNKVNNVNSDEDLDFNTNLISDINLQNFDMKRYEYYTNLLYIYKNDPDTLYNLLNKYYNIKNFKKKEKNIIKYISNYARLLKKLDPIITQPVLEGKEGKEGEERKGGSGNSYDKLISKLKEKVQNNIIDDSSNKDKFMFNKTYEDINYSEHVTEDESKEKLNNVLKMLNETLEDIKKQENLFDIENKTETSNTLNKTVKHTIDIVKKLLYYINNDDSSAKTKSLLNKTVNSSIDIIKKLIGSIKKDNGTNINNILNSTVQPAIKLVQKLLANINKQSISKEKISVKTPYGNATVTSSLTFENAVNNQPNTNTIGIQRDNTLQQLNTQQQDNQLNGPFGGPTRLDTANANKPKVLQTKKISQPTSQLTSQPTSQPTSQQNISKSQVSELIKKFEPNRTVGGNPNEDLKIKYLDTQKYKKLSNADLDELKGVKGLHTEDDDNKIGQLSIDIDDYYANKDKEDIDDKNKYDKDIIQKIKNFEEDPKNPLEELALTFDDRIVFIIATFFIRYITIIMVQWCIDINIIKTFYEGFIYYAVIYIIIFWFIVLFINIDNSFDVKYMNFNGIINSIRTLFYYFYMGTNGISRLLIHTSLIMILIIIPIILNIKKKEEYNDDEQTDSIKILNYDERKQLSKSLSLFTMFIWLFTSIIATKF